MHKQTTQEARFCYTRAASRVLGSHSHLWEGKGKKKRNKELRALSRVLQGQPFSLNASKCSRSCSHHLGPPWEFWWGPGWLPHGQSPQEAQGEGAQAGSLLQSLQKRSLNESRHWQNLEEQTLLYRYKKSCPDFFFECLLHYQLSSASLLMLLVIPLSLPSWVYFIIITLSKAQGEPASALCLERKLWPNWQEKGRLESEVIPLAALQIMQRGSKEALRGVWAGGSAWAC